MVLKPVSGFSAWLIGENSLGIECAQLLLNRGHHVGGIPTTACHTERRGKRSTVYSVRLNADEVEAVQRAAAAANVPAATLVRSWIRDRLGFGSQEELLRGIVHDEVRAAIQEVLGSARLA